jgi:hypothetical protein
MEDLIMKKLIMFVMVLAIAASAGATRFPHPPPDFAGCANSGMVFWEFLTDGCDPTSDIQDPPYVFDPELPDPTFGTRYQDGGPVWTWSAGDGAKGIYTCDDEDSLNGSIPVRGDETYMRMYFQVVHTLVASDDESLIGMGLELWDMGEWAGCPEMYEGVGEYLEGYEFPAPTYTELIGGVWHRSTWVADFSTDGAVWSFGDTDREFGDLFEATHTTAIIAMGDFGASGFDMEEVVMDYIWFSESDYSDIPDEPCWGAEAPITVDTNDIPVYEPQDAGGPPPMGPTDGQLQISLAWKPGEDLGYPPFICTVVVDPDPNVEHVGNPDFSFTKPVPPDPNGNVTLTFTQANWDIYQNVHVAATQDLLREGNESGNVEFRVTINIDDPNFGSDPCRPVSTTQGIIVVDNDIPYISVLPRGQLEDILTENNPLVPRCVNVTLSHLPTHNVEIRAFIESEFDLIYDQVIVDPNFEDWTDPNHLLFTPGNYNSPQQICLKVLDDEEHPDTDDEWIPGTLFVNGASDDIRYEAESDDGDGELEPTQVNFNVQDNDCGAWGFYAEDTNGDCVIDLSELAALWTQWHYCTLKDGRSVPAGVAIWADCDAAWNLEEAEEE